jgi:predicted membrane-bound spermidine synthase
MLALPTFSEPLLEVVLASIDDVRTGSLLAAFVVMFFPVTLYGVYSPFAIRLMLRSAQRSGVVSGTVYGVSTAGSIVGTLGTTFFLIPTIGTRAITLTLGAAGVICGLVLIALRSERRRLVAVLLAIVCGTLAAPMVRADTLFDESVRAAMLKRRDGQIAHVETQYTDLFVYKVKTLLTMSSFYRRNQYLESVTNLADPDELYLGYARNITSSLAYPKEPKRLLMVGLGAGTLSTYIGRHMGDLTIDAVEVDPGVIKTTKTYFGVRETEKVHIIENDGRVFLNRAREPYDII